MSKMVNTPRRWFIFGGLIAILVAAGIFWQGAVGQDRTSPQDAQAIAQARGMSRAFRSAANKVMPTVVKIWTTTKPVRVENPHGLRGENPLKGTPFEEFFDEDRMPGSRFREFTPPQQGIGSGVIIDAKGIILTNNHVVSNADEVRVELADGRQFTATDIRTDEQTDLAVVRIKADAPLPVARLGDSDRMEIGDWVLAIGNPFELQTSVSAGIISGKGRALRPRSDSKFGSRTNFLQTDAAINPGNSGGPLVNLDGEVIGINTAIKSSTGGYQGVGFAVPSNVASWVTKQLIATGNVRRAYLGVQIGQVDARVADKLRVPQGRGVLVAEIYPDTPAAAAGFKLGDVILAFAGQPVNSPRQLQAVVERSAFGSKQKIEIVRDGRKTELSVVVKPLPENFGTASTSPADPDPRRSAPGRHVDELGMEVGALTDEVARKLGYQELAGVVVTGVDADGIAARAGIGEGMLIRQVGKTEVGTVAQFESAMKDQSLKEGILLLVRAKNRNHFIVLQRS